MITTSHLINYTIIVLGVPCTPIRHARLFRTLEEYQVSINFCTSKVQMACGCLDPGHCHPGGANLISAISTLYILEWCSHIGTLVCNIGPCLWSRLWHTVYCVRCTLVYHVHPNYRAITTLTLAIYRHCTPLAVSWVKGQHSITYSIH